MFTLQSKVQLAHKKQYKEGLKTLFEHIGLCSHTVMYLQWTLYLPVEISWTSLGGSSQGAEKIGHKGN